MKSGNLILIRNLQELPEKMLLHCNVLLPLLLLYLVAVASAQAIGQARADSNPLHHKLVVGVSQQPPFCMQDANGDWSGISVDLWKEIAKKLNYDYEFKSSDLAGMVTGMDNHTFDLEVCPAFITAEGEAAIDFSAPYFVDDTAIAINSDQQPGFAEAVRAVVTNPTSSLVVLGILLVTVVGAAVLWMLEHEGESEHYQGKTKLAFLKSLYWSVAVLSGRDFPSTVGLKAVPPATKWGRMFGLLWMLLGGLLFSFFTACAASLLTSRQLQPFVTDWGDLRHMRVGTVTESDAKEYLGSLQVKSTSYATPLELVTALSQHHIDAAVFGRAGLVYYAEAVFHDKVVVLPIPSPRSCMGLPLQPGSPLRKPINRELLKVVEGKQWPLTVAKYQNGN